MMVRLAFVLLILAGIAAAQENVEQDAATESTAEQGAEATEAEPSVDDEFIPTKEVPADEEVNFPVDI